MAEKKPRPRDIGSVARREEVFFADDQRSPEHFRQTVCEPKTWLCNAYSLLRAARRLLENIQRDRPRLHTSNGSADGDWSLEHPCMLLAALAVENALKAVIVAKEGAKLFPLGNEEKLPECLKRHELDKLADSGGLVCTNSDEKNVLKRGAYIISAFGRYPSTLHAKDQPMAHGYSSPAFFQASERLFISCARATGLNDTEVARYHVLTGAKPDL